MAIRRYLAMTQWEFTKQLIQPWQPGWMACHFSPYGNGLCNLPEHLPEGSLLILNDRIPPMNNNPDRIFATLDRLITTHTCSALLLDFQHPKCTLTATIAKRLQALPCPVAVSEAYAEPLSCPVFLPPVPLLIPIREYLAPWGGREIWLEAALSCAKVFVDTKGSRMNQIPPSGEALPFRDDTLFCHYKTTLRDNAAAFLLQRTRQDLDDLLQQAAQLGVTTAVGLWQELN